MLTTDQRAQRGAANLQPHAAPDYAALATQAVEALWAKPRSEWTAGGDEHRAVTRILTAWERERGVAEHAMRTMRRGARRAPGAPGSCPTCEEGRRGPNGGSCQACRKKRDRQRKARVAA